MKHKQQRREEAEDRQKEYDKLTSKQRLALLDSRRGQSKKERDRHENTEHKTIQKV